MKWLKAFRTWMRVVLPFEWAIVIWIAALLGFYGMALWGVAFGDSKDVDEYLNGTIVVSSAFAAIYGIYRVWYFHPLEHRIYGEWLQRTPWTPGDPLPLGPLHFVWQDLVVIVVLGITNPEPVITIRFVVASFIIGYCGTQAAFACFRREPLGAYGFVALLGLGIIGAKMILVPIACAIGMVAVAYVSNMRLLLCVKSHDLSKEGESKAGQTFFNLTSTTPEGWPAGYLLRDDCYQGVPQIHAIGIGLTLSWISYSLLWHYPLDLFDEASDQIAFRVLGGIPFVLLYVALPRILKYCWNHRPPISLLGRLRTGQLIIRGYDKVFVFALVAVIGWLGAFQLLRLGLDIRLTIAMSLGFLAWAVLGIGPSMRKWHYTGHHRIAPGFKSSQRFSSL